MLTVLRVLARLIQKLTVGCGATDGPLTTHGYGFGPRGESPEHAESAIAAAGAVGGAAVNGVIGGVKGAVSAPEAVCAVAAGLFPRLWLRWLSSVRPVPSDWWSGG